MGKGMGAVDKNMRKELSLEIDGHASAPVSRRRHAIIHTHAGARINT